MIGKYKLLVNDEVITSSNNYDKILDKFVKEVTEQEKVHLNKGECIRVTIKADDKVYLENCIRHQEEKQNEKNKNVRCK